MGVGWLRFWDSGSERIASLGMRDLVRLLANRCFRALPWAIHPKP